MYRKWKGKIGCRKKFDATSHRWKKTQERPFERFTNSSFPQKLFLFKKKMSRAFFVWFGKMNKKWKIKKKKNYCVFSKKNKGK